jgi:vacuolar iron transporter family protein
MHPVYDGRFRRDLKRCVSFFGVGFEEEKGPHYNRGIQLPPDNRGIEPPEQQRTDDRRLPGWRERGGVVRHSLKTGVSFGLTSGVITTLGLMVGLYSSTRSTSVVTGGVLVIAVADSLSDALGIHISEESENKHSAREIWEATLATFGAKFLVTVTFIVPVLILSLRTALIVSVVWGYLLICLFSYFISRKHDPKPWKVVGEHFVITTAVIIITHLIGGWISQHFG